VKDLVKPAGAFHQGTGVYFFRLFLGAFLRAPHAKTGLSTPIPQLYLR
jgi:hypothetical protein